MRTVAPAKINWTLEVLGRREDGYHESRSVMQTIDLCDEVTVRKGNRKSEIGNRGTIVSTGSATLAVEGDLDAGENDLTLRAVRALEDATGWALPVTISLVKRIPVAAGLGGGSSDAAAVLRGLDRLWGLGWDNDRQAEGAAWIGSDVTFFLSGGTALAGGRGECITPLSDAPTAWLVLLVPPIKVPGKTRRMYETLTAEHFSDGSRSEVLSQRLRREEPVRQEDLYNAFERVAYDVFEGLEAYRDALLEAGAKAAHLAGAGPALFALTESEAEAKDLAERVQAPGAKVFVTRTLSAQEGTAITD
jgi:4-diphosphocytidyl-2-C-methyl-D-erythritol kinase